MIKPNASERAVDEMFQNVLETNSEESWLRYAQNDLQYNINSEVKPLFA